MVAINANRITDPIECQKCINFLVDNEVRFFKTKSGQYCADIALVDSSDQCAVLKPQQVTNHLNQVTEGDEKMTGQLETQPDKALLEELEEIDYRDIPNSSHPKENPALVSKLLVPYNGFFVLAGARTELVRPYIRSRKWLTLLIFELYKHYEKVYMESGKKTGLHDKGHSFVHGFSAVVADYLYDRHGLRPIVEQRSWDLAFNLHRVRQTDLFVEIFALFLEEYYDEMDLDFFFELQHKINHLLPVGNHIRLSKHEYGSPKVSGQPHTVRDSYRTSETLYLKWAEVLAIYKSLEMNEKHIWQYLGLAVLQRLRGRCYTLPVSLELKVMQTFVKVDDFLYELLSEFHNNRHKAGFPAAMLDSGEPDFEVKDHEYSDDALAVTNDSALQESGSASASDESKDEHDSDTSSTLTSAQVSNASLDKASCDVLVSSIEDSEISKSQFAGNTSKPKPYSPSIPSLSIGEDCVSATDRSDGNVKEYIKRTNRNMTPKTISSRLANLANESAAERVIADILDAMEICKERYLDSLMENHKWLGPEASLRVSEELRKHINRASRTILEDAIANVSNRSSTMEYFYEIMPSVSSLAKLQNIYKKILQAYISEKVTFTEMRRAVQDFCETMFEMVELRREVEPVLALLATYTLANSN